MAPKRKSKASAASKQQPAQVNQKKRKKLSDLKTEEFLSFGLDSDIEDDIQEDADHQETENHIKPSSNASKHQQQLQRLQEKDPEFYKYLKGNDQKLLEFDISDEDNDDEDDGDDDKNHSQSSSTDESDDQEEATDNDATNKDYEHQDFDNQQPTGKVVTTEMVNKWREMITSYSFSALKQIAKVFHAGVHQRILTKDDKRKEKFTYIIDHDDVLNAVVNLCLSNVHLYLDHFFPPPPSSEGSNKKSCLPSSSKKWPQFKLSIKLYLADLLQLFKHISDPKMLCGILRSFKQIICHCACFPKLCRQYDKHLIQLWSTSKQEDVRVLAFLCIRKLIDYVPSKQLNDTIKLMYTAYIRNCKFTTPSTLPFITFMQSCLLEVYNIDGSVTYQHAFVYIRQVAIHLRNAMTLKKKDAYQTVYNWQYLHCIHLWCRILSDISCKEALKPLVYPLVQTVLGVIRLIPTARFYPLRFHCIRSLNYLARSTKTYIPVSSYLVEILEVPELTKKKMKESTGKPIDFSYILSMPKSKLNTKQFYDGTVENIFELLLDHYATNSYSISFPELVFLAVRKLRQFLKETNISQYRRQLKQLTDKIEETSKIIETKRLLVTFGPKDDKEIERWETALMSNISPIEKYYQTWTTAKVDRMKQEKEAATISTNKPENKKIKPGKNAKSTTTKIAKKSKTENEIKDKNTSDDSLSSADEDDDAIVDLEFSDSSSD